jgi:hypothetical protein
MAEFDIATPVKFISRHGRICAALVVNVISDDRADLVWWDTDNVGIQTFAAGVKFSNEVASSSTFHLASTDLTPKTDDEKIQFRLNAVESSGLENMTVAPGTGQTIAPIAGVPSEQQVTPTDGKAAEKAIDPMEVPPLTPVVITEPPQQDRAGQITTTEEGTITPPVDPNQPQPVEQKGEDASLSA